VNLSLAAGKMETRTERPHTTGRQKCPRAKGGRKKNAGAYFRNHDGAILPMQKARVKRYH